MFAVNVPGYGAVDGSVQVAVRHHAGTFATRTLFDTVMFSSRSWRSKLGVIDVNEAVVPDGIAVVVIVNTC